MAKDKANKAAAAAAAASEAIAKTYVLGPQSDGAIVIRVPDDFALMVLRKAVEKQERNATAADGTIGALAEGEDPFLDRVQRVLAKLKQLLAQARAPENQIADTPIGKEINAATRAALAGEKGEPIDGQPEGTVWAPHVPRPRPRLGQLVVYADETSAKIVGISGYDEAQRGFFVAAADGSNAAQTHTVTAHDVGDTNVVWRVVGANYPTPTVAPSLAQQLPEQASTSSNGSSTGKAADELLDATKDSDALLRDAPAGTDDDDVADAPAAATASASEKKKPAAKKATANLSQRERNQQSSGIRPAPKPSAAKKNGGKK